MGMGDVLATASAYGLDLLTLRPEEEGGGKQEGQEKGVLCTPETCS